MAGEYRNPEVLERFEDVILADMIRQGELRIALTSTPTSNIKRFDLHKRFIAEFDRIGMPKYADGLRNGSMVVIAPVDSNRYYQPGELFLKS